MNYTSGTRTKFTKRLKYSKLIDSVKKKYKSPQNIVNEIKNIREEIKKLQTINKKICKLSTKSINENIKEINYLKSELPILNNLLKISKISLKDTEELLSEYNSKTCNNNEFLKYAKLRNIHDYKLNYHYDTEYIRKLKWFAYLNKQKHENELLN